MGLPSQALQSTLFAIVVDGAVFPPSSEEATITVCGNTVSPNTFFALTEEHGAVLALLRVRRLGGGGGGAGGGARYEVGDPRATSAVRFCCHGGSESSVENGRPLSTSSTFRLETIQG